MKKRYSKSLLRQSAIMILLCVGGCNRPTTHTALEYPSASARIVITDSASGAAINGAMLVTVYGETAEVLDSVNAGSEAGHFHTTKTDITRIDSGYTLSQEAQYRTVITTNGVGKTHFKLVEYYILARGYLGGGFPGSDLVSYAEQGKDVPVALKAKKPEDSDVHVLSASRYYLEDVIPFIPADNVLRSELIALLQHQVENVLATGHSNDEAKEVLKKLRDAASK